MAENAEPHFDIQVLAALVRDAELICESLSTAGIVCRVSESVSAAAADISGRTDILLLFEEALDGNSIGCLADALGRQPPWSDLPVIVLTGGGAANRETERLARMREPLGNVTLIERPLRTITLVSSVRAAIRARQKQYDIRNHLEKLKQADEALRRSNERLEGQVAERTAALRQLSASLIRSQDEERRRIARELHDSLGQYLAGLAMELHQLAESGNSQLLGELRSKRLTPASVKPALFLIYCTRRCSMKSASPRLCNGMWRVSSSAAELKSLWTSLRYRDCQATSRLQFSGCCRRR